MAPSDPDSPIASLLASLLPSSISLTLHHLSTPPTKTPSLFSPPPGQKAPTTTLETHFLSISHDGVLVFAIEVLIYTTSRTSSRTFFVSKADSSGYLSPELASFTTSAGGRQSTLRTIATGFIKHLFNSFREADPTITATISLFARSQTQYLFPNSAVNEKKHVLTDRGLISWWCKVLDPILQEHASPSNSGGAKGYLLVPGFDSLETRPLFPPILSATQEKWVNGHPYKLDAEADITVREVIPHFPDDPKSRFLDELGSDEKRDKTKSIVQRGQGWKNVRTIEQFWELMSFRQECSLGRCVGFLWIVLDGEEKAKVERKIMPMKRRSSKPLLTPEDSQIQPCVATTEPGEEPEKPTPTPSPPQPDAPATEKPDLRPLITTIPVEPVPTPEISSPEPSTPAVFSPTLSPTSPTSPHKSNKRPSTSTTVPTSPTKKLRTTNPTLQPILSSTAPIKPLILLDEKQYTRVIDSLLNHADFGDKENAYRSSGKWLEGAAIAAGKEGADKEAWGVNVKGLLAIGDQKTVTQSVGIVNVLAVRKKPKPAEAPVVNTLPASLIRKKPVATVLATEIAKTTAEVEKEVDKQGRAVNVLPAGLMRKKAKPTVQEVKAETSPKTVGETERLRRTEEAEVEVDRAGRKINVLGKELMRRKEKVMEVAGATKVVSEEGKQVSGA